jgi:hypothetical protein
MTNELAPGMEADPTNSPLNDNAQASGVPPPLPASGPPVIGIAPAVSTGSPTPVHQVSRGRRFMAILLSLCLGLFLAEAVVSVVDDSLLLFLGVGLFSGLRGALFVSATLVAVLVYGLMGLTRMIPKRWFVPVTLFGPVAQLAILPVFIYDFGRVQQAGLGVSLCQVVAGLSILHRVQGGFKMRWPLVGEERLEGRGFGWLNLFLFVVANVFVLLPATVVYLLFCARLAAGHFSDGFLALQPGGITVQVRKYVRNDGKTIQLVPMSHIGEPEFYRQLTESFPTNALILMEGVTDDKNLLTNKLSYARAATSLGLAEQQREFKPSRSEWVRADVDIAEFTTNTIDFLNLVTLIHAKGVNAATLLPLMQYSPSPHFQEQLLGDLIGKRNRRVVEEVQARLSESENIIVPWGAAHMPGIAREILKSGFRLAETREYTAIRFGFGESAGKGGNSAKPK